MTRLTRNISKKQSYCAYELKDCTYKDLYDLKNYSELEEYIDCDLSLAVDKLGELEDVMEKHNIENANELDHSLDVLEAFKQSLKITRVEPVEPPKITENGDFISPLVRYVIETNQQKLDEKTREALTKWIMQNIDKETILKWLGVYKGEWYVYIKILKSTMCVCVRSGVRN